MEINQRRAQANLSHTFSLRAESEIPGVLGEVKSCYCESLARFAESKHRYRIIWGVWRVIMPTVTAVAVPGKYFFPPIRSDPGRSSSPLLALSGRLVNISTSCRTLVCSVSLSFHPLCLVRYIYNPPARRITLPFLRLLLFLPLRRRRHSHEKAPSLDSVLVSFCFFVFCTSFLFISLMALQLIGNYFYAWIVWRNW